MTRKIACIAAVVFLSALPVVVPAAQQAQPVPAEVGGLWNLFIGTLNRSRFTMELVQQGAKLSGYVGNEVAEYPITGSIDGAQVRLVWSTYEAGDKVEFTFTGKVEQDLISGTAKVGALAEVTASARRAE